MTPNTIDKNAQISFDAQFIFKFLNHFQKCPFSAILFKIGVTDHQCFWLCFLILFKSA